MTRGPLRLSLGTRLGEEDIEAFLAAAGDAARDELPVLARAGAYVCQGAPPSPRSGQGSCENLPGTP
ncbi:hypothetical protein [Streptomyces abikoensis]|uniref:hypothetical protein n=1 Tax=Streptomyces abikoensis TaxID=97398 RepID=UPI0033D93B57